MGWLLIMAFWIIVLVYLGRWIFGDQSGRRLPEQAVSQEELDRLREDVDRLNAQMTRLIDEQSFMVRMLSEGDRKRLEERTRTNPEPPPNPNPGPDA